MAALDYICIRYVFRIRSGSQGGCSKGTWRNGATRIDVQVELPAKRNSARHSIQAPNTEHEYDAAAEIMDDPGNPPDTPSGPGPYPGPPYSAQPQAVLLARYQVDLTT